MVDLSWRSGEGANGEGLESRGEHEILDNYGHLGCQLVSGGEPGTCAGR